MPPLVMILGTLTLLSGLAVLLMLLRRRHAAAARTVVAPSKQAPPESVLPRLAAEFEEASAYDLAPNWEAKATFEAQEEQEDDAYLAPPMVSSLDYLEQLATKAHGDPVDTQHVEELGANFSHEAGSEARTMSKICPRCGSRYSFRYSVCSHDESELSLLN